MLVWLLIMDLYLSVYLLFSKENINSSYNLDQLIKYLELAGFPNGKGLSPIVLNTTSSYLDLCEFVQSELKKIGIDLIIEVNPPSTHINDEALQN